MSTYTLSRPVYIESYICVVKDVVKCSFKNLCVVHQTCHQKKVGVGEGTIEKIAEEYFGSAIYPWSKNYLSKKRGPTLRKKLGIGSPVFCI